MFFAAAITGSAMAQENNSEVSQIGCATVTTAEELQRIYEFNQLPPAVLRTTESVDTIPLTIHLVGRNDSTGYYSLDQLFQVLCELNERYAPVNMYFNIKWPIRYINNSAYYEHNNSTGSTMMANHNVANTVNVYFVSDPAGACGYYSPYRDGVAIAIKCSAPASTTLVHELGHFFGLPHTFVGWENNTTPPLSNQERVARTGPQANCTSAGDGFCDTDADYISERWNDCNNYPAHTDPTGAVVTPDGSLYMSYSPDKCMSRFSPSQIAYMRYNLNNDPRRAGLRNYTKPDEWQTMAQPDIIYPGDYLYANYKKVIWRKVAGAEFYHVKITTNSVFLTVYQEAVTADTSLDLSVDFRDRASLKVTVTPMNSRNVCGLTSQSHPFLATDEHVKLDVADVVANNDGTIRVAPNPVRGGNNIRVYTGDMTAGDYQIYLYNMNGQTVLQQSYSAFNGAEYFELSTQSMPAGVYFLKAIGNNGVQLVEKLVIQN